MILTYENDIHEGMTGFGMKQRLCIKGAKALRRCINTMSLEVGSNRRQGHERGVEFLIVYYIVMKFAWTGTLPS